MTESPALLVGLHSHIRHSPVSATYDSSSNFIDSTLIFIVRVTLVQKKTKHVPKKLKYLREKHFVRAVN